MPSFLHTKWSRVLRGRSVFVESARNPLFCLCTLRSALSCNGEVHPHAADNDGGVLLQERQDMETTHPEVASSGRCEFFFCSK